MPATVSHFRALDGWRGLCALIVALCHFPATGALQTAPIVLNADFFVDFFFVLSGFVIAANYLQRLPDGRAAAYFMGLRLGRLYPLHLATFLAFLAFELLQTAVHGSEGAFNMMNEAAAIPTNLLLIHSWGMHDQITWNWPSWSISCEIAAYAAFALITAYAGRARLWIYAGMIFVSLALLWRLSGGNYVSTWDYGVLRCFAGFFAGVFAFKTWRLLSARAAHCPVGTLTAMECVTAALVIAFVSANGWGAWSFAAPFVFTLAVIVFSFDRGALSRLLHHPAFQLLGLLSYSIYMVHGFIVMRFANVMVYFGGELGVKHAVNRLNANTYTISGIPGEVLSLAFIAVVIAVSYFTYHHIEVPGRNAVRRWLDQRMKTPASA